MVSYEQGDSRLLGGNGHEWPGKLPELYRTVSLMTPKVKRTRIASSLLEETISGEAGARGLPDLTKVKKMVSGTYSEAS